MKENYRKAAHVMYECGNRLGLELSSLQGVKKQAQSYLACINSLKLVNKKYQWIVKPGCGLAASGKSPKRAFDGEESEVTGLRAMEVIELPEIEKELAGYKKRDTVELIRVYHQLGYIEMAGEVAIQYIQAVMAEGAEYFGLEEALGKDGLTTASKSPAWMSWTVLDRLVLEFRENSDHAGVKQVLLNSVLL